MIATLDYLKAQLGITDTNSDTLLSTNIMPGANAAIENYCKQVFEVATYSDYLRGQDDFILQLPHCPIVSITSITIDPYETSPEVIAGGNTAFDANRGQCWVLPTYSGSQFFRKAWRGIPNVLVSYSAGYSTIPSDLQDAFALACKQRLLSIGNTSDTQSLSMEKVGDWQGTYASTTSFIDKDMGVKLILDRYKDFAGGIA